MNDIVKALLYSFLSIGTIFGVLFFILFTPYLGNFVDSMMGQKWVEKTLDLEAFNKNPEKYLNLDVVVTGTLELYSNEYRNCPVSVNRLTDKKGYQIRICAPKEDFKKGEEYTLKGKIVKDVSDSTGVEYYILRVE